MSDARPHKRRVVNLSINRAMQFRMIGRIGLIVLLSLIVSSAIYFFFSNREISASFQLFHIHARNFLDLLLPVVLVSFVVSLVIGGAATLFFPGSIAGGLYGIEREVRKVADGNLTARIALRKGDAVHDLAAEINRMVEGLQARLSGIEQGVEQAQGVCASGEVSGAGLESLHRKLGEIRQELRGLKLS